MNKKTLIIIISNCEDSDHFGEAEILREVVFNVISDKEGVRMQIVQDGVYLRTLIRKLLNLRVP